MRKLIAKIDVPVRQVMIEARIVEADDSFSKNLGVRLGYVDQRLAAGQSGNSIGGDIRVEWRGNLNAVAGERLGQATAPCPRRCQLRQPAGDRHRTASTAATFALSCSTQALTRFLNLELSALEADGKGKIISSPRVLTADQVEALIEQGTEIPVPAGDLERRHLACRSARPTWRSKVKPQITPDGNVIMTLDVNKDSVGRRPRRRASQISTKHVKTEVLVENGGTVVIGGIYEQNDRNDITKVPFLGDLPYLGWLFKTQHHSTTKTELLIFITPRVVTDRTAVR